MKKNRYILVIAILMVLSIAVFTCKKTDPTEDFSKVRTQIAETENTLSDTLLAGTGCLYSSPVGYCTAGVRLEKGGTISGELICNGVKWHGDAKNWYINAEAAGFEVGATPIVGAIVVWNYGTYGHVGIVTKKENGIWFYKAMNDYPNGFNAWSERKIQEFPNKANPIDPVGYIYSFWK